MIPEQIDLLSYRDGGPGWKGKDTSREAAAAIEPAVSRLEQIVLDTIHDHGPMSADQIAAVSGVHFMSIRPRCSQLSKEDRPGGPKLKDTGSRSVNASGRHAVIWDLVR